MLSSGVWNGVNLSKFRKKLLQKSCTLKKEAITTRSRNFLKFLPDYTSSHTKDNVTVLLFLLFPNIIGVTAQYDYFL